MSKQTVATTNNRIDALEEQMSDVFENFDRRITDLEESIETMQRVIVNLDEETKTAIWLNAENLHKAKAFMKATRQMAKKALAQQSNGTRAPQQQPHRTVNTTEEITGEIPTVPAGSKGAVKCNACGNLHPEVAHVRACYKRKYANA